MIAQPLHYPKSKRPVGRTNCWEFYSCPDDRQHMCSAYRKKAGRSCWLIAGTLCGGKTQGFFAKKIGDCQKCDFFIQIKEHQL